MSIILLTTAAVTVSSAAALRPSGVRVTAWGFWSNRAASIRVVLTEGETDSGVVSFVGQKFFVVP